jgi:hypothetical protein
MKNKLNIIRITKEEYELSDGRVYPHMIDFEEEKIPSIEDFQKIYDKIKNFLNIET